MTGRIITIAQQKGGSGKTTVVAHLAVAFARRMNLSVAILDIDPQGSLGSWFEAREARFGEGGTGLSFRTASGWGARREARGLARDHDIVLLDTPPKSDNEARFAMEQADLVAVPVQPTPVDLWATEATLRLIEREGLPSVLILNRVPPRAALTGEMAETIAALGSVAAEARLGNRVGFAASMGEGRTLLETDASGKGAAEVEALAGEVARMARADAAPTRAAR